METVSQRFFTTFMFLCLLTACLLVACGGSKPGLDGGGAQPAGDAGLEANAPRGDAGLDADANSNPAALDAGTCAQGLTRCGNVCADTSSDPAHCGACGTSCKSTESCQLGVCTPKPPTIIQDNFASAANLPASTRSFEATVRFSEPVTGVADGVTVNGGAVVDAIKTIDPANYSIRFDGLYNATTFTVQFGAKIQSLAGVALQPTQRTIVVGGKVLYVVVGGRGTKDGSTPANAMASISAAISTAHAEPGTDVWVAEGTYHEELSMLPPDAVYGGWDQAFATRDVAAHPTIVQLGGEVLNVGSGAGGEAVVDGLTLQANEPYNPTDTSSTEAVYVHPGAESLLLRNCGIEHTGGYQGWGIYAGGRNVTVERCSINVSGGFDNHVAYGSGRFLSNLMFATDGSVYGGGTTLVLVGNTIVTTATLGHGVDFTVPGGVVADNVFIGKGTAVSALSSGPYRLENNAFWGWNTLYFSPGTAEVNSVATLNNSSAIGASIASQNVVVDPKLDAQGRPTKDTPNQIRTGGRSLVDPAYGPAPWDVTGAPRTAPYSIGAYQIN